uniref:tRNA carboxymethyluridine synthase n=1 Tax=Chloropicon primus TaxID=1764295 RepID=A0A7S2SYY0_9CHLO
MVALGPVKAEEGKGECEGGACSTSSCSGVSSYDNPLNLPGWRDKNYAPEDSPFTYMRHETKGRALNRDVEDIYKRWDDIIPEEKMETFRSMVCEIVEGRPETDRDLTKLLTVSRRRHKMIPKKSQLLHMYRTMRSNGEVEEIPHIEKLLMKKSGKSSSGVLVITVVTSPYPTVNGKVQTFSCKWDCHYCPNEPGQPRSYLHDEPSVLRANQNSFDACLQFTDRAATLAQNGHPVDKIEIIVLGGTWASYPEEYREEFCRDLFYAANTFYERKKRGRYAIEEEQRINESAQCKIIGLTLETRPDTINPAELHRLRKYGCTRVQIGVQHTNDAILKKINRKHYRKDAVRAIQMLKDTCYKIDIHLMPNLPGSSPEIDKEMFLDVLYSDDMQVDQWKIYPCEVVPWTKIKKWFDEGTFVPYGLEKLIEVLMYGKSRVHPWIRLNRVVRDIPSQYILGGVDVPNLREDVASIMRKQGNPCKCIRCREVHDNKKAIKQAELVVRKYRGSGADEYFISFETPDRSKICGFVRLRLSETAGAGVFPELERTALVRELHVYGVLVATENKQKKTAQHVGFGKRMMLHAEKIAWRSGYRRMAVIAGVGTRNYYRKLGYEMEGEGEFMVKSLECPLTWREWMLDRTTLKYCALGLGAVAVPLALASYLWGPRSKTQQHQDVSPP